MRDMTQEQKKIWAYLARYAKGEDRKKTSAHIRTTLGLPAGDATNKLIRSAIRALVVKHGKCIGSVANRYGNGYWVIEDEDQLDAAVANLENRANTIHKRVRLLEKNFRSRG